MSKNYWLTPEEVFHRKKRNKGILYGTIMIGVILLTTIATLLAHQIS